jgi:predicted RNA-binding protein with PIN domain
MIIVDGYNLLYNVSPYSSLVQTDLESARQKLIRRLEHYVHVSGDPVTVVFDGIPNATSEERQDASSHMGKSGENSVRVIYSQHQDADRAIESLVSQQRHSRGPQKVRSVTVVTEDRELIRRIKRLGAQHKGHKAFIEQQGEAKEAWGSQDTHRSGPSMFEKLDADSLNALKTFRMKLISR